MRIAVLGRGNIGGTIGQRWTEAGLDVLYGVRSPSAEDESVIADALETAEIVLFAVPSAAVPPLLQAHAHRLDGKILIDATNDFARSPMGQVGALVGACPAAAVVRAFSTLGWEVFADPTFDSERPDLFYCGPDDDSLVDTVHDLIIATGLRPMRLGNLDKAPLVDAMTRVWFALAIESRLGRHLAFKTLLDE